MIEVKAGRMKKSTSCACSTCKQELGRGEHVVLIEYDEIGPRAIVLVGVLVEHCDDTFGVVRFYDTPEERDAAMPAIQSEMEKFFPRLRAGHQDRLSFCAITAEPFGFALSAPKSSLSVPRITAKGLSGPIVVRKQG